MRILPSLPLKMTVAEALEFKAKAEEELAYLNEQIAFCPDFLKPVMAQVIKEREADLAAVDEELRTVSIYPHYPRGDRE